MGCILIGSCYTHSLITLQQFVLQKASDYITYLKEKIEGACDDMAIVRDNNEDGLMSFDIPFENKMGK